MSDHYPPVDDPGHTTCDDVSHMPWNLPGAIEAVERVGIAALNSENRALREALTHLQAQFEVSQGIADLAIQQRDQAIAERDVARAVNHD